MNKIFFVIIYLIVQTAFLFPNNNLIKFDHYSLEQGLSQVSVNCIIQDKYGFLWIGTDDGLNKFDGYKFTVYRNNPEDETSLSRNHIWSIYEDKAGNLWIGTFGGGLNKFNRHTEKFEHFYADKENTNSLQSNDVYSIIGDSDNNLWIGTIGGGLHKFNLENKTFTNYQFKQTDESSLSNNNIYSIFKDSFNNIWIGTFGGGLNRIEFSNDKKNLKFIRYKNNPNNKKSISNNFIRSICEDSKGNLWIATDRGGLNKLDLNKFYNGQTVFNHYRHHSHNPESISKDVIYSVFADSKNNVWIGSGGEGLNKLNYSNNTFSRYKTQPENPQSLSNNFVRVLFEDLSGNLWIGTGGKGLSKFSLSTGKIKHYKHSPNNLRGLSNNYVYPIYEDSKKNIWIGTDGGLNLFNPVSGKFKSYKNKPENPNSLGYNFIRALIEDKNGNLWIGTYGSGLDKFDIKSNSFKHYKSNINDKKTISDGYVRDILIDSKGNFWVGTQNGLNLFNSETGEFTRIYNNPKDSTSLCNNNIRVLYEDSNANLWIGTNLGVNKLDLNNFNKSNLNKISFIHYSHNQNETGSLNHNITLSIYEDQQKNIWIATVAGINKISNPSNSQQISVKHYSTKNGLPNNVVYSILEDENKNLWLSTNKGISKFNPETEIFKNYDQKNGLQSNEFNASAALKHSNGDFYFGGVNGLNVFNPDSLKENISIPPVIITELLLFNEIENVRNSNILTKSITHSEELVLDYTDYIFAFEFSALNYDQPDKNKYAYKLEGLHEDWINTDSKNRRATFTNLEDGEYLFRVKACNSDGYWNDEGHSIKVTILPPMWKSWWANLLYLFTILFCLYLLFLSQKKKVFQKQRELDLEKQFSEKLELYNKTLEEKVDERTKELKTATNNAEEANRLKTELLSIAAHDLKNPLNIILGFSSLIKNDIPENSESTEYLESIRKSSDDMLEIISKLLDSAAIETGKLKLEMESVNLIHIVDSVVNEYQTLAFNKKQFLSIELPARSIYIKADTGRIKEVFSNIVSNAIKYSPLDSKIKVTFREDSNKVLVDIEDDGQGISIQDQKNLFKKFQKLSSVPTGGESSTGLGLSIAKKLTELHKGSIEVKSNIGEGSKFTIILPIEKIVETISENDSEKKSQDVNFFNQRIIIADDLRENRKLIIQLLKKYNLTLIEVNDGIELIEMSNKIRPDFIFCDINMPGMNGLEALKIIRSSEDLKSIPVVAVTSLRKNEIKNADFDSLLLKPITQLKLVEELKTHLKFSSDSKEKNPSTVARFEKLTELKQEILKIKKSEIFILKKKFQQANSTMIIDDVLNLATFIEYLSNKNNLIELKILSQSLQENCKNFDVQKINNSLFVLSEISK